MRRKCSTPQRVRCARALVPRPHDGSLSVTWDDHYRAPFAPLCPDVQFVPMDDPKALKAAVSSATAAVIVEPLQVRAACGR